MQIESKKNLIKQFDNEMDSNLIQVVRSFFYKGYQSGDVTTTRVDKENNGKWLTNNFDNIGGDYDLTYIKTRGVKKVEVHSWAAPYYANALIHVESVFDPEENGVWQMANFKGNPDIRDNDLAYIKLRGTGSGKVEIHVASRASEYQTIIHQLPTGFSADANEVGNGVWQLTDFDSKNKPDLVFIKTKNTASNKVEIHMASGSFDYKTVKIIPTIFENQNDGTWLMAHFGSQIPDLVYIKTQNTESNKVEIHTLTSQSGYKEWGLKVATNIDIQKDGNQRWCMNEGADQLRGQVTWYWPDLVQLKY